MVQIYGAFWKIMSPYMYFLGTLEGLRVRKRSNIDQKLTDIRLLSTFCTFPLHKNGKLIHFLVVLIYRDY